jgi:hypothetical protein
MYVYKSEFCYISAPDSASLSPYMFHLSKAQNRYQDLPHSQQQVDGIKT